MALARPTQQAVPFASSGVKNAIPETATGSNLASLQEGFPTITMTDVDNGGMPPQGQDMNGILFDVTTAIRYQQAGGLFPYDATFAAAIDGYPLGAILTATDGSCLYQNTVSGNQTDPENGGTGWSQILSSASIAGKQDKLSPTQMDAVNSGITAARVAIYDGYAAGKQNTLTFDNAPASGSTNPVTSNGVYTALGTKQNTLTFDNTPTASSTNPVTSDGIKTAVDAKVSISGGNASATVATATGSTTARTLADWTANILKQEQSNKSIVLVVAGQSNAVGSTGGTGSAYQSSITVSTGGYWNNDTGTWVSGVADPVWPTTSGSFIPSLCNALTERTGRPVYIINVAVSNTVVASQNDEHTADQKWSSNGTLRERALQIVNNALATLGVPYELLGTVWMQGESDATGIKNGHETLADYTTCINDTVSWFQQNIGGRFFCVPISYNAVSSYDTTVDSLNQVLLSTVRKFRSLIVGSDFTKYARQNGYLRDTYHFTVAGYDILGDQIAHGIAGMLNGVRTGKRIRFVSDEHFPDYDTLMTVGLVTGATLQYLYPQAVAYFRKNNVEYLFVLVTTNSDSTPTDTTFVTTVYDINTQEYKGCFLLPHSGLTEGIVVRTESDGDYIYAKNRSNELVKYKFNVSNLTGPLDTSDINAEVARVTLTQQVVTDSNGDAVTFSVFLSYMNGRWLMDSLTNRVAGFGQRALNFYDDNFDIVGTWDLQRYEQDIWTGYDNADSGSWTIPRTQGISIGVDGVYLFKGGGTNAADTLTPVTDCGIDHYSFNGDLVRTSVCEHTPFVKRMVGLLGLTASHSENEAGFCTDDGRCYWFGVFGGHTGKIALLEEFSDAPDAVDFSDCMSVYRTNVPFRSNVPLFPKANGMRNPWTGEELTSLDDFIMMCATYGIDDIQLSCYGLSWAPEIHGVTIWDSINFNLRLSRCNSGVYFAFITGYGTAIPTVWGIQLSGGAITSCSQKTGFTNVNYIGRNIDTDGINICGCTAVTNRGARLTLFGKDSSSNAGVAQFYVYDGVNTARYLAIKPDGALRWTGTSIESTVDNSCTLGISGKRFKEIYCANATINTSDYRLKDNIQDIDDDVLDAWGLVNIRVFQFKDAIEKKGEDSARLHMGVIAQQVQRAFEAKGLDAFRFGLLCYDEWEAKDAVVETVKRLVSDAVYDESGNEISSAVYEDVVEEIEPAMEAGNRYSIRYSEALVLEAAYQRRRADRIEARLQALEERLNDAGTR